MNKKYANSIADVVLQLCIFAFHISQITRTNDIANFHKSSLLSWIWGFSKWPFLLFRVYSEFNARLMQRYFRVNYSEHNLSFRVLLFLIPWITRVSSGYSELTKPGINLAVKNLVFDCSVWTFEVMVQLSNKMTFCNWTELNAEAR